MSQPFNLVKNKIEELPNNIEAEQSVIGSILLANETFDEISLIINELLKLSNKYKTNELKFDDEVSDTMYEMF